MTGNDFSGIVVVVMGSYVAVTGWRSRTVTDADLVEITKANIFYAALSLSKCLARSMSCAVPSTISRKLPAETF